MDFLTARCRRVFDRRVREKQSSLDVDRIVADEVGPDRKRGMPGTRQRAVSSRAIEPSRAAENGEGSDEPRLRPVNRPRSDRFEPKRRPIIKGKNWKKCECAGTVCVVGQAGEVDGADCSIGQECQSGEARQRCHVTVHVTNVQGLTRGHVCDHPNSERFVNSRSRAPVSHCVSIGIAGGTRFRLDVTFFSRRRMLVEHI